MQTILLLLGSFLVNQVYGHGHLMNPSPDFLKPNDDPTKYCATLDGPKVLPADTTYDVGPGENTRLFTINAKAKGYQTLRDFLKLDTTCGECGITDPNGRAQTLPSIVKWANGQEGFISSHEGPCELWCDDTRVFQNDNCAKNVPSGNMQIDTSKCVGAKRLTMLWLALHSPQWQIYKNCVNLSGVGPSPNPNPSPSPSPSSNSPTMYPTSDPWTSAPKTPSPTNNPTSDPWTSAPNTPSPTSTPQPNSSGPVAAWKQCGGAGYAHNLPCEDGFVCQSMSATFSQCVANQPNKGQLGRWAQCGGMYYTGSTECSPGDSCVASNPWFSQCLPKH